MKNENGELFITLEGRLDTLTSPGFDKELEAALPEASSITMDFGKLEYISSAGLRTLLEAQQYMEDKGYPNIRVLNINDTVRETFELTGFNEMLDI
jgi:anti-sigma B factor antagonist